MSKGSIFALVCGVVIILLAPLLGNSLSAIYLSLLGGMATDKFLLVVDGCIRGFQIIGAMSGLYGILKIINSKRT